MSIKPDERSLADLREQQEADAKDVLASRPRLRRDVLYTQVPEGVLFHDATSGFRLHSASAYRFASLVVPFLDGEHRVAELCAGLGDGQRRMVVDLVRSLYQRGFARDVPAVDPERAVFLGEDVRRRFAAQIAYVDHHADDAHDRFLRFRETSVAVLGDDEIARWAALSLVRNGVASVGVLDADQTVGAVEAEATDLRADGCPVEVRRIEATSQPLGWPDLETFDVVVVTPGAGDDAQLLELLASGVPAGRTLLPAWLIGGSAVVGPLMTTGEAGCWACAALRVAANIDPGEAANFWRGNLLNTGAGARQPSGPLSAMIGNLLGYEIFRITTGALPAETAGKLIVQDLDSLDVSVQSLQPHPQCPFCPAAQAEAVDATVAAPSGRHEPGRAVPEPGRAEVDAQLERLDRHHVLIQPQAGVFTGFADEPLIQTPLRVSAVDLALDHTERRRIAAFDVHNVVGARLSALARAAGVYADRNVSATVRSGADNALAQLPAVQPSALSIWSGIDTDQVQAWVAATSLTGQGPVLVPAAAVETRGRHNTGRIFVPTMAGIGVDGSAAQARGAALLSALAYDALQAAVRGRLVLRSVELAGVDEDPVLTFLIRSAANLGVEPELIELGDAAEQPVPVLLARCPDPAGGPDLWTVAADPSWRSAAVAALRDLLGRVQLSRQLDGQPVDTGDPLMGDLDPAALATSGTVAARPELSTSIEAALQRLRRSGADAFAVSKDSRDLRAGGLFAAKVLIARVAGDAG